MTYKAFISYSHSADDKLAPALQSALHRFAKPFYRLRAVRVFRDKTSLHLTPELWPLIQQALAGSEYFLLLASPDAAQSHWVQAEVAEWLKMKGGADKMLLVLTEGEIAWDDAANDFDWNRTDALPSNLRNVFRREPLYSDLRWARKATDLSLRNPQFLDEIGSLGATLHGKPKDEMIGNDVRQHRLFKTITAAALVLLLALTAAASSTAFYAVRQRNEAQRQTFEAERQRRSAVEAADRERKAAESERVARDNEERERKKAEQATENEKVAKNQAEERRRDAERQRLLADQRRLEAERERNLANSRELAASADSQLTSDPELSVMLSLKAHERTPTVEAEEALRRSLIRSHLRATFRYLSWFKDVAFSPDGKWLILVTDRAEVIEPGTWRKLTELERPTQWSSVGGVSVSRDGKRALTISYSLENKQSTVRVWETGIWRSIADLHVADDDQLSEAVMSPDGKLVATWSMLVKTPRVWSVDSRQAIDLGGPQRLGKIVFSPDSKTVLTAGEGRAILWDAATGSRLYETDCGTDILFSGPSFSPDGKYIVLNCGKEMPGGGVTARVVASATGQKVSDLVGHTLYLTSATFSPDGKWLVTTGADRTARVWEMETWQAVAVLRGHNGALKGAKFSGDGRLLVTPGADGVARVWEAGSWSSVTVLQGHTRPLIDLAVSFDGRNVVTFATDSTARVWQIDTGNGVTEIEGFAENGGGSAAPTVYSPDGNLIATRAAGGIVEIWEAAKSRRLAQLDRGNFLAFSPDGEWVYTTAKEFVVQRWETRTWQKAGELRGHTDQVMDVAFSPDGKWMVTAGGYDNTARVWETATGKSFAVLQGHSWRVVRVTFSPDGHWIGTASYDKTARVWEVGTWREVAVLRGHSEECWAIAFNRDGSRVVTASNDRTARLWETATWREVAVLLGHRNWVTEAEFSPDGKTVLTAGWDHTARLWEAETGKAVAVLAGHTDIVNSARFSPDGRLVATTGEMTVRIWDGMTGRVMGVLPVFTRGLDSSGSERSVRAASFSPDGKSLLASGSDGTTRIYTWEMFAPLEDLLALGRTRVTRELTPVEKKKYLHQTADGSERAARPE